MYLFPTSGCKNEIHIRKIPHGKVKPSEGQITGKSLQHGCKYKMLNGFTHTLQILTYLNSLLLLIE